MKPCSALSFRLLTGVMAAGMLAAPAAGQDVSGLIDGWVVEGTNTLTVEAYHSAGNSAGSPYTRLGIQPYDDLQATFHRDVSPFRRWYGDISLLWNDSPYRSSEQGILAERFNMTYLNGEGRMPYRAEVGDFYGFFSPRTLQRPLKGGQIDLQPGGGLGSLQFLGGVSAPDYRNFDPGRDTFVGTSALIEPAGAAPIALNLVRGHRESRVARDGNDIRQTILSAASEQNLPVLGRAHALEGELAHFFGDTDVAGGSRKDRHDRGAFTRIASRGADPFSYSLRLESYGDDFRPTGATITPNRRTIDGRSGYRFANGGTVSTRAQRFTDNYEAATSRRTSVGGVTYSGSLDLNPFPTALRDPYIVVDAFQQGVLDRARTTDLETRQIRTDLSAGLVDSAWNLRMGAGLGSTTDNITFADTSTRELTGGGDRAISLGDLSGLVSPGFALRWANGTTDYVEAGPDLALQLAGGPHSLRGQAALLVQRVDEGNDLRVARFGASYEYAMEADTLGLEVAWSDRDPATLGGTTAYKLGVFWRRAFGYDGRRPSVPSGIATAELARGEGPPRILDWRPGEPAGEAFATAERIGLRVSASAGDYTIFEATPFPELPQRQRVVLKNEDGRLAIAAFVIDSGARGGPDTIDDIYERVRAELSRRLGSPARTFDRGVFGGDPAADIRAETVARLSEWSAPGGTIRAGVPRRLDGTVRVEVQYRTSFPPPRDSLWSVEAVR